MEEEAAPPRRLHVVTVITRLDLGGAQETAVCCARSLDVARFRATFIAGTESMHGEYESELRTTGVRLILMSTLKGRVRAVHDLRSLVHLWRLFRKERPDIVHTHSSKAGVLGRLAARASGVPVTVHTVHGWSFNIGTSAVMRPAVMMLERMLARLTTALVVVGDADRRVGLRERIGSPAQYLLIRSGVDLARFRADPGARGEGRRILGVGPSQRVVGTVGRLSRQKSPDVFLAVAQQVGAVLPDVKFVMVGDGPLRELIEQRIRDLDLGSVVTITGDRRDVEMVLPAFDVFLLTSSWEGMPRAVIEAMAVGTPVVAADVGSVSEIVLHERTGLLVAPGDVPGFSHAVTRLLADPEWGHRMVAEAQSMLPAFGAARMVAQHEDLYTGLAVQTRRAPRRRLIMLARRKASTQERK